MIRKVFICSEEGRRKDRPKRHGNNAKTKKEKNSPQKSHDDKDPSQNYRKYTRKVLVILSISKFLIAGLSREIPVLRHHFGLP